MVKIIDFYGYYYVIRENSIILSEVQRELKNKKVAKVLKR